MLKDIKLTGRFDGDLQTYGRLTVAEGGEVRGTIDAGALTLEPGNLVEAIVSVRKHELPAPDPLKEIKKVAAKKPPEDSGGSTGWTSPFQKLKEMALGRR